MMATVNKAPAVDYLRKDVLCTSFLPFWCWLWDIISIEVLAIHNEKLSTTDSKLEYDNNRENE